MRTSCSSTLFQRTKLAGAFHRHANDEDDETLCPDSVRLRRIWQERNSVQSCLRVTTRGSTIIQRYHAKMSLIFVMIFVTLREYSTMTGWVREKMASSN
jgi:hypothetical protein